MLNLSIHVYCESDIKKNSYAEWIYQNFLTLITNHIIAFSIDIFMYFDNVEWILFHEAIVFI